MSHVDMNQPWSGVFKTAGCLFHETTSVIKSKQTEL